MKQAIAGVTPPETGEATIMTVWPTIAATKLGQLVGRLCGVRAGVGIFNLGKLFAVLSIPLALALFFGMLTPWSARRYRLTNRRVAIERGPKAVAERWVELDRFDTIEVIVQPGQEWYPAGDLVFRKGPIETFRLLGVSRPETFRRTCLKARQGYVGARAAQ